MKGVGRGGRGMKGVGQGEGMKGKGIGHILFHGMNERNGARTAQEEKKILLVYSII